MERESTEVFSGSRGDEKDGYMDRRLLDDAENERLEMTLRALESARKHGTPEPYVDWLAAECGVPNWKRA
jgi:hypothetical protein